MEEKSLENIVIKKNCKGNNCNQLFSRISENQKSVDTGKTKLIVTIILIIIIILVIFINIRLYDY